MHLSQLIDALSSPDAYPDTVGAVEVRQTHISVVFLAGEYVYKVKKPVDQGFLDFRRLEDRRHFCQEEVRLNRRLAPSVYLGVVPITRSGDQICVEGDGAVVEYAVKMKRLPDAATLKTRLLAGAVTADDVEKLARLLARFHANADSSERISSFGRYEVVAGNARENFNQSAAQIGATVSPAVFERLRSLTEDKLRGLRSLIGARADRGVPRDTHGDLHLDHVYLPPGQDEPIIIDCIEFNERFRFADPVADMAFLVMDLLFHRRKDLAKCFADVYFQAAGDDEGRRLLPFYTAYRAAVRAKVDGLQAAEEEVAPAERESARCRAKAHWLLALGELEEPGRKPCLLLVGGLPGAGKSTLARGLAERAGFTVIRADVVRKELAGIPSLASGRSLPEDIYTDEWTERTFSECLARAEALLFDGGRVIVDATFRSEKMRKPFLEGARAHAVPGLLLICEADLDTMRQRLQERRGDASDADFAVFQRLAAEWEAPAAGTPARTISTAGSREEALERALAILREDQLAPIP